MVWFRKKKYTVLEAPQKKDRIPDGLWHKCENCLNILYKKDFEANFKVCPKCNYHQRLTCWERIDLLIDKGTFVEDNVDIYPADPLGFVDSKPYSQRLEEAQKKTELADAVVTGSGTINGYRVEIAVMDFRFIGGSMGSVVGEKVTRSFEHALEHNLPVIAVCTSGGARMQEGILSLMQMAKTSIAVARLNEARIPYITVLTHPTTAGVMASFASLGDVVIAEPNALIGFAGPRVIQQTINQILPKGFQLSEFVCEHGFIDIVVHRKELKKTLSTLLSFFTKTSPV
ncbi:acetyl-CoA carboxylase carboxyltransferase subunit beta [Candidatus Sumerlaeota bacterium]|nr:acetyl-CoA carboxylase carboxyltransferase subunit beta [Candidatus Sumerlaeota bacterium]